MCLLTKYKIAVLILSIFAIVSCGGGSSNGDDTSTLKISAPLAGNVKDVTINENVPTDIKFVYDLPIDTSPAVTGLEIDLNKTLSTASVSLPGSSSNKASTNSTNSKRDKISARATETVTMRIYIASAAEESTVCTSGEEFGPFEISVSDGTQLDSVSPSSATASQSSLSIINTGSVSLCLRIESSVEAVLDIDELAGEATRCDIGAADIDGFYIGTFTCKNTGCDDDVDQDISMNITQNGHSASYSSGEANYDGTVCGNVFRHNGGLPGSYTESGTLTFSADGKTASKTSSWRSIDGSCSGTCADNLRKYEVGEFSDENF